VSERPAVSLIVPFGGNADEARVLIERLRLVEIGPGDERIVVDNSLDGVAALADPAVTVVRADAQRSSYYARNVGAEAARNNWLLFVDADCEPAADILDAYLAQLPDEGVGALAGDVFDAEQDAVVARYTRSRQLLDADRGAAFEYKPAAVTANLMVRREAWAAVGGFLEAIRSGGDSDFSWRVQDAGFELRRRPGAAVYHHHRETVGDYLSQKVRYGSSRAWLTRRYPGSYPPLHAWHWVPRAFAASLRWALTGDRERATFRALDGIGGVGEAWGFLRANSVDVVAPLQTGDNPIAIVTDRFPELSETFIAQEALALQRLGRPVHIEATNRALTPDRAAARELPAHFMEDDPPARRARDFAWLVARHPSSVVKDCFARLRWRRQEHVLPLSAVACVARRVHRAGCTHVHAHFAARAALTAMRVARLLGLPYSVTAHAYDIYLDKRNLEEKLRSAAFATSGCDYTVADLREIAGPETAPRIHKQIMGIDPQRFVRSRPYPGGKRILSIGRLVEKKGFADLIAAATLLDDEGVTVGIVGDGPLREALAEAIREHGVEDRVELLGPRQPAEVRALLEEADVFCLPCVVAANGDRDSMPVVVKEALALELPVVVTDEVGLPELVRADWGALVPPHDPEALAAALSRVLELKPAERAAMGRAGREFVTEFCDVGRETARLAELIAQVE
jgi:glycosyltransferase involved in cell wall biosynthesis/GT2 family glycosyltransferase